MKPLLLDLWNDLRAKRLWPVAALLVLALVAVPVLLSKPFEEPRAAEPDTAERTTKEPRPGFDALRQIRLAEAAASGSSFDTSDPSNPFRPSASVLKELREGSSTVTTPTDVTSVAGGATDTGSDTATPSIAGGGEASPPVTPAPPTPAPKTTITKYRYEIDVTFVANGRKRRIEGMDALDMLPSRVSPLLIFLGVSPRAGNAVFLVDSTLDAAGEGKCRPSVAECALLYLGAGSKHEFTNADGDSYMVRVNKIHQVEIGSSGGASTAPAGDAGSFEKSAAENETASGTSGASSPSRPFQVPELIDLVTLSTARRAP